jgi:protein O-GlcNAc transferase
MISLPGDTLASRVASALLTTLGCPELIAESRDDYMNKVVHYARHPEALRQIQLKVRRQRVRSPLFDTKLLTHNLERAFLAMWAQYERHGHPAHLEVKGYNTLAEWKADRKAHAEEAPGSDGSSGVESSASGGHTVDR